MTNPGGLSKAAFLQTNWQLTSSDSVPPKVWQIFHHIDGTSAPGDGYYSVVNNVAPSQEITQSSTCRPQIYPQMEQAT